MLFKEPNVIPTIFVEVLPNCAPLFCVLSGEYDVYDVCVQEGGGLCVSVFVCMRVSLRTIPINTGCLVGYTCWMP